MKTAQTLATGHTHDFGPLFKGVSAEQIKGKVVSTTPDLAVVEATYMGVSLGEATLTKQHGTDGSSAWLWNWN